MQDGIFPDDLGVRFERVLAEDVGIPEYQRFYFKKWVADFWDFCRVRSLPGEDSGALEVFLEGLRKRGRLGFQVEQAKLAVTIYWKHFPAGVLVRNGKGSTEGAKVTVKKEVDGISGDWRMAFAALVRQIKLRHYSAKTLKSYHHWVRSFSRYVGEMPVGALTSGKAGDFLAYLAQERKVSASTQNQAFSALLFFYTHVLEKGLDGLEKTPRAVRRQDVPMVLTRTEVQAVIAGLEYPYKLFVQLVYGCGLRLGEALSIRVQDLDLEGGSLHVHHGKGGKSRALPLPKSLLPTLIKHMQSVRGIFEEDLKVGFAGVFLPDALERKYPNAARSWPWQWIFPGGRLTVSEGDGKLRRFHLHESSVQKEIKAAAESGRLSKRVTAHTFRHSYATHLLQMGYDIRVVQDLMGHNDVSTTMIYTHALQALSGKVTSPLDV